MQRVHNWIWESTQHKLEGLRSDWRFHYPLTELVVDDRRVLGSDSKVDERRVCSCGAILFCSEKFFAVRPCSEDLCECTLQPARCVRVLRVLLSILERTTQN